MAAETHMELWPPYESPVMAFPSGPIMVLYNESTTSNNSLIIVILIPVRFKVVRIIDSAAIHIKSRNLPVYCNNNDIIQICVPFKISVVRHLVFRVIASTGQKRCYCISFTIVVKTVPAIAAKTTMKVIDDRIAGEAVLRIIIDGYKYPKCPVYPKLPAMVNHIGKRGKQSDCHNKDPYEFTLYRHPFTKKSKKKSFPEYRTYKSPASGKDLT